MSRLSESSGRLKSLSLTHLFLNLDASSGAAKMNNRRKAIDEEYRMLSSIPMPFTGYRNSTIGQALIASIEELRSTLHPEALPESLGQKLMVAFDVAMQHHLENSAKSKINIKVGQLKSYKCLDNEWVMDLRNVEVRENYQFASMKKVTLIAGPSAKARAKKKVRRH